MRGKRGSPLRLQLTWPSTTAMNGLPDEKWTFFVSSLAEIAIGILLTNSLFPKKRLKRTSSTSWRNSAQTIARRRSRSAFAGDSFSFKKPWNTFVTTLHGEGARVRASRHTWHYDGISGLAHPEIEGFLFYPGLVRGGGNPAGGVVNQLLPSCCLAAETT